MKKVLMKLGQWILKYRKKLIYGALALFIGQICFFGLGGIGVQNEVFADDSQEETLETKLNDTKKVMSLVQKMIYVLVYPFLMIVGKLVDNSLVYGEIFGFDAVLWDLWIIIRNVANFALGFIFIFYIFKYLISQKDEDSPKKLIPRALIAGVLIQASWFIMAALIDLSTIVTYSVGGLPIKVLGANSGGGVELEGYNPYILNTAVSIDAKDIDSYYVYLSNKENTDFIASCKTFTYSYTGANGENIQEELILSPEIVYYLSGAEDCYPTQLNRCHIGDAVYKFSSNIDVNTSNISSCTDFKNAQNDLATYISDNITNYKNYTSGAIENAVNQGFLLRPGKTGDNQGMDDGNKTIGTEWNSWKLEDILSGSYVGVFGALYGSLLNAGKDLTITTESTGMYVELLNVGLSLFHMLAINIPLIVMVLVFMIRICVLWLAIALSPIIVLLKVFNFEDKIDKLNVDFLKYIKVSNLIGIIFSPAIICFAISISTVLVRIISLQNLNVIDTPILGGLVVINISGLGVSLGKLIVSVLGIAITRFLMRAAVKSSAIGQSEFIKKIEDATKSALGAMPIVPIIGKDGKTHYMGVNTVFGGNGRDGIISNMASNIKSKYDRESTSALNSLLMDKGEAAKQAQKKAEEYALTTYIATLLGTSEISPDWQTSITVNTMDSNNHPVTTSYNTLSDAGKQQVIEKINGISDTDRRKRFFDTNEELKIGDKTYNFDKKENKWVIKKGT